MDAEQNLTNQDALTEAVKHEFYDERYTTLIEFKALGGIITDQEGNMRTLSMQNLAEMIGVRRETLYEWMKRPGFWDAVNNTRRTISKKSRLAKIQDKWYLKALEMKDWRITDAWLRNHDENYREPKQKVEHELGNSWAALLKQNRNNTAIEGEVVDNGRTDA